MKTKHTPGPWRVWENLIQVSPNGPSICYFEAGQQPSEANARLIAAAPELLAALINLTATARTFRNVPKREQEWTPIDDEAIDAAFAAIDKVTI